MERKNFLLKTVRQMNGGAILSGIGFLLFIAASALGWEAVGNVLSAVFGLVAFYVFLSAEAGRKKDRDAVSYSLLWGTGALAILMLGYTVLTIRAALQG